MSSAEMPAYRSQPSEGQRTTKEFSDCHADPAEDAARLGLEIVPSQANLLQLDIDKGSEFLVDFFDKWAGEAGVVYRTETTRSKSGNKHVYVLLDRNYPEVVRIALQACFGSDRMRETFGVLRSLKGSRAASVLFETPAEAAKIRAWLQADHFGEQARGRRMVRGVYEVVCGLAMAWTIAVVIYWLLGRL